MPRGMRPIAHRSAQGVIVLPSLKLLISARSFGRIDPAHMSRLREAGFTIYECRETVDMDRSHLEAILPDVETWVVSAYRIDEELLSMGRNLRLIIKHGIGIRKYFKDVRKCKT